MRFCISLYFISIIPTPPAARADHEHPFIAPPFAFFVLLAVHVLISPQSTQRGAKTDFKTWTKEDTQLSNLRSSMPTPRPRIAKQYVYTPSRGVTLGAFICGSLFLKKPGSSRISDNLFITHFLFYSKNNCLCPDFSALRCILFFAEIVSALFSHSILRHS